MCHNTVRTARPCQSGHAAAQHESPGQRTLTLQAGVKGHLPRRHCIATASCMWVTAADGPVGFMPQLRSDQAPTCKQHCS
jgi:hypothetical protein